MLPIYNGIQEACFGFILNTNNPVISKIFCYNNNATMGNRNCIYYATLYKSCNHWVTYKLCRAHNVKKSVAEWTARDRRLHTQRAEERVQWGQGGFARPLSPRVLVVFCSAIASSLFCPLKYARQKACCGRPPLSCPLPKRERE